MKPIFLNLMAYETTVRLPDNFAELVKESAFDGISRDAFRAHGFAELCNEERVIESDGRTLIRYVYQEKRINKSARNALLDERIKQIEEDGREVTDETRWQLTEQIERELLPYSPVSALSCFVLFCPHENRIYLSCSSESIAEQVLGFIRSTLGSLPVWPVLFCGDLSQRFSQYIASQGATKDEFPKALRVDVFGSLSCIGEDGKKLSTSNLSLHDESVENLVSSDHLIVRGLEVSLHHEANGEVEATFKLTLPSSGHALIKKFDYSGSVDFQLDVCVANEEGDGGLLHQYTVEMLMVGRYAGRIFNALAEFAGGYHSRKNTESGDVKHA